MIFSYSFACNFSIKGNIVDEHDGTALAFASVYIIETNSFYNSNEDGYIEINDLCEQTYTLVVAHISCQPDTQKILVNKDISIQLYLEHHTELLQEIQTTSDRIKEDFGNSIKLNRIDFLNNQGKDITTILGNINGISILKTGANISKPIVNGFFNDRVSLVYNGILLNTQDWSPDHAPELDANSITKANIVTNSSFVEYTTQNTGAVVLLEQQNISLSKYKKFGVLSSFQTNNLGTSISTFWQQSFEKSYGFRVQFSYKKAADSNTPKYNLSNTGNEEIAFTLLQKIKIGKNIVAAINYNYIQQELGILRAAHIGNINDLNNAIASDTPLIILPRTFEISSPKQHINHHQADAKLIYTLKKNAFLEFRNNIQHNRRKEFDIRRGGRSNIPALDMNLLTYSSKVSYNHEKYVAKNNDWLWIHKSGINYLYKNNTNNAETGIVPLIPDYIQHNIGLFSTHEFNKQNIKVDVGARIEYSYALAYTFDKNANIIFNKYRFIPYSISSNVYIPNKIVNLQTGITLTTKLPNMNELHSNGLHHGTASIEYGNSKLKLEKAFQWNNILQYNYKKHIHIELFYRLQYIKDYIYLAPDSLPIYTIRGAFPVFHYISTNALIQNIAIQAQSQISTFASLQMKYNMIRAKDLTTKDYIINIPPDALHASIKFFKDFKKVTNTFVELESKYVFRQKRTPTEMKDFKPAPDNYWLLNANLGVTFNLGSNHKLVTSLQFENILNKTYRDYLNRLRYFADEVGFNSTIRIQYFFN